MRGLLFPLNSGKRRISMTLVQTDPLSAVVEDGVISSEVAVRYLSLYLGESNWPKHIMTIWRRRLKGSSEDQAKDYMRNLISFVVCLSEKDESKLTDPPENFLFWAQKYDELYEEDWFSKFQSIVKKDVEILKAQKSLISLGYIDPIEYCPTTRQAFNWLFERTDMSTEAKNVYETFVKIYGGTAIISVFNDDKSRSAVARNHRWRRPYFFERLVHQVYNLDQLMKIKTSELKKANETLVHSLHL